MKCLDRMRTELEGVLAGLDPSAVDPAVSGSVLAGFVAIGKLADAGAVVVAHSMAAAHPHGVGGATRDLARTAGVSQAEAERVVATSKVLGSLPATRAALVSGRLSRAQAGLIADAASDAPESEAELLATAALQDLVGLRRHVERVKATCGDAKSRRARAQADRCARSWVRGGMWHMHLQGPVDAGARIQLAHRPFWEAALAAGPKGPDREPFGAYGFDGMVAMAEAAMAGGGSGADAGGAKQPKKRRWQGVVRADAAALRRGHATTGEIVEIVGVGPIDVDAAIALLGEATVRILIKDGYDVLAIATATRAYPASLAVAVAEKGDWECANRSCSNSAFVEHDHTDDFARSHDSSYRNLWPLCGRCHDDKTYRGYRITDLGDGTIDLLAPDDPDPP